LILGLVLLIGGSWVSVSLRQRDFDEQAVAYSEQLQARLRLQVSGAGNALGRAPEPALRVIRPPAAGAILVQGRDAWLPAAWEVTPAGAEALQSYATGGRRAEGTSAWDLAALVRVLAGFLAFAAGAAGVLGDRSSGWSLGLRALPLSPGVTSGARIIGGCIALAMLVGAWWLALALVLTHTSVLDAYSLGQIWLLTLPTLLYLWILFGAGVALAWLFHSGFRALSTGVAAWLCIAVMGPSVLSLGAQIIVPVAPQVGMERERREQFADDMRAAQEQIGRQLSARLPVALTMLDLDVVAVGEFAHVEPDWQAAVREARARAEAVEGAWRSQKGRQQRLTRRAAWALPGALVQEAMAELVDTGLSTVAAWDTAVASHETVLNRVLFDDRPSVNLRVKVGVLDNLMLFDRHKPARFGDLPIFTPPVRDWSVRLAALQSCGTSLVLWALVALVSAWLAGVRGLRLLR
jgi:ABC-type transport system involved in multi-copper enzyme maturation permease subunit